MYRTDPKSADRIDFRLKNYIFYSDCIVYLFPKIPQTFGKTKGIQIMKVNINLSDFTINV